MNKSELVSKMAARLDGDRTTATAAVNGVLEEIEQSLARGEKVSLFGFGTFDRRERGPRLARNPATGQTIQLGASVAPVFRPGAGLRQVLTQSAGTPGTAAAVAAAPAAAASVTAPAGKAAKKAAPKSPKSASKAAAKPSVKAADKGKPKAVKASARKSSKKAAGKGAKKG